MTTTYPQTPPPAPLADGRANNIVNARTWSAACHASALLGVFVHFPGHLIPPLVVWLAKRDESPEIDAHGKEAVNFQLSMLIYNIIAGVFCLILIGFLMLPVLWVLNAVLSIIAAIKASDGELYRYPLTIRFLQ